MEYFTEAVLVKECKVDASSERLLIDYLTSDVRTLFKYMAQW